MVKMTAPFTSLGKRLKLAATAMERGQIGLAQRLDVHRNTVTRWVKDKTSPSDAEIEEVAAVTGYDAEWLKTGEGVAQPVPSVFERLTSNPPDAAEFEAAFARGMAAAGRAPLIPPLVPVLGTVAGSIIGSMALSEDAVEYANRPVGVANVADAYGLRVVGTSMLERFREGELVIVHPHRHIVKGDIIVIQEQLHAASHVSAYIKEFVRHTKDGIETVQYNPRQPVEFRNIRIKSVHRVMTTNELFGL
jgi:phage repressor protein C with HTH and peptisase S24 domain